MANVKTLNKELVNKLCSIIKGYDPYTAYIEDYKQYSNAVDNNCKLDQQFIHTCKEYGYDIGVSFCYSLAKSLASGKFDSAEETVIDYINSLTKEDDSILSSPSTTPEDNDNTNKEETIMSKTKIRRDSHESFELWINRINDLLSSNGIHLDNDKLLTIIDDETDCVSIESEDINVHGWCAGEPFYCCYDFHGNLKEYSDEGTNFESVEVEKEEDIMTNNANTTETNNSATVEKEEFTMKELVKRITENKKVHDKGYIDRPTLKTIMNEQFGFNFSNRSTRTEMVEALMNKYKDSLRVENEDNSVKEEMTMKKTEAVPATHQVICIDHAYYDDEYIAFTGTQEECNNYIERHFTEEDARLGLCSYTIHPVPAVTKVNNPAPDDAKVLTYRLMHMIGDHALSNRKKGFGTTISAKILCAFIVEVASLNDPEPIDRLYVPTGKKDKYGKDITMINPKITEEHKNKCKDVRNWLLNHGYIKPVTFKDEKGFTFYTPEYDGNRKDKMYDCTKFQATGKVETTTYIVTKEMNKWYV